VKILIIGGSPKGEVSVTMQFIRYIMKRFPENQYNIVYAAQKIHKILKDKDSQKQVFVQIKDADMVLWAFPLYYMMVHANLKRFIQLCFSHHADAFQGKYAAALSTSIHFYDHTAHNYIQAVSEDLGMKFITGCSSKMHDLLEAKGPKELDHFASYIFHALEEKMEVPRHYYPIPYSSWEYQSGTVEEPVISDKKVLILIDQPGGNAETMAEYAESLFQGKAEKVYLSDLKISGGCLGCLKCGPDNICAYQDKDDYVEFFKEKVTPADMVIWVGTIYDRYLSWQWKQFFDRSFFKTHQPVLQNKQFLFLVSGPLAQMGNVKEIFTAYTEMEGSRLVGFISDECRDSSCLDKMIAHSISNGIYASNLGYFHNSTFRYSAGRRIFRDEIFERLRVVFKMDHRTYRKIGYYDYQGRSIFNRIKLVIANMITSIPFIKRGMFSQMPKYMIQPYQKILEKTNDR